MFPRPSKSGAGIWLPGSRTRAKCGCAALTGNIAGFWCAPIRNAEGLIVGTVIVNEDVTERVRAGEALHRTQTELVRVARLTMMGELAASIAHEVNQPLAAVVTNANASLRWLAAVPPNL